MLQKQNLRQQSGIGLEVSYIHFVLILTLPYIIDVSNRVWCRTIPLLFHFSKKYAAQFHNKKKPFASL